MQARAEMQARAKMRARAEILEEKRDEEKQDGRRLCRHAVSAMKATERRQASATRYAQQAL